MKIGKALLLSGRDEDDLAWPTALAEPRQLFPLANRPILFHNLEALRAAGVTEATILAQGDAAATIRDAVGDGSRWGLCVHHAEWFPSEGVAGALAAQREFLDGAPVLVQQGGALLRERIHPHIAAFTRERLDALVLRLTRTTTVPQRGAAPGYLLSPRAISILADGPMSDANPVADLRARGGRVRIQRVEGLLPCKGDLESLLESNRSMLEGLRRSTDPASLVDCDIQGQVEIHPTAHVERSLLRGPVIVGPGARITDAYIGPYTSIGAGVVVEGAEIEHSIVLPEAVLSFIGTRLESSVIGRGARVVRGFSLPSTLRMALGDGAEVVLR
jgi:glucose-1-phosphate thymidylyltransferase